MSYPPKIIAMGNKILSEQQRKEITLSERTKKKSRHPELLESYCALLSTETSIAYKGHYSKRKMLENSGLIWRY